MAISNLTASSLTNRLAISNQQYGVNPFSPVKQKSESDNIFEKMNSLDGSFEKNRISPYGSASRITAPVETGAVQPQEKQQKQGFFSNLLSSIMPATDDMEMLNDPKIQALLNNEELLNPSRGKSYNLNDGEIHPVYSEKYYDEVA